MKGCDIQPCSTGLDWIKGLQQEIGPLGHQKQTHASGDCQGCKQVSAINTKHVTKQDMVEMNIRLDARIENQPERKHSGKHHTHDGIALDPAIFSQIPSCQGTTHASCKRPDYQGEAQQISKHNAGQNGMTYRVPHQ